MIPLYVLGLLQRYGPQHGYQLKKTISEELEDFTQIKLPTIYYHLEKMSAQGLITGSSEKAGARPEKTIYAITLTGKEAFTDMLREQLSTRYRPAFPGDSLFFFSDHLSVEEVFCSLKDQLVHLQQSLNTIDQHKRQTLALIPEDAKPMVNIIFAHHEYHFRAELEWVAYSLRQMKGEQES
jgi:DNA-binding PadR family transcriptional regulator